MRGLVISRGDNQRGGEGRSAQQINLGHSRRLTAESSKLRRTQPAGRAPWTEHSSQVQRA